jgi:hypothetical protein
MSRYSAPLIPSSAGTVKVGGWCGSFQDVRASGYRCNPDHKYPELRNRAGLSLDTGAAVLSFNATRDELLALSDLLRDMADTIPAEQVQEAA